MNEARKRSKPAATSSATSAANKIEISEDHLHGPFNFSAHRREATKMSRQKQKLRAQFRVRDDIFDDAMDVDGSASNSSKAPTPPVIDLRATPPPQLVDLSAPDQKEVRELVSHLTNMFPDTPIEFFEEHAEDLVGKPAAFERLVALKVVALLSPF